MSTCSSSSFVRGRPTGHETRIQLRRPAPCLGTGCRAVGLDLAAVNDAEVTCLCATEQLVLLAVSCRMPAQLEPTLTSVLAQIRKGHSLPVSGVACRWKGRFPGPRSAPAEAACNLLPGVRGRESGLSSVELGDHGVELDVAPATSSEQPDVELTPKSLPQNRNRHGRRAQGCARDYLVERR